MITPSSALGREDGAHPRWGRRDRPSGFRERERLPFAIEVRTAPDPPSKLGTSPDLDRHDFVGDVDGQIKGRIASASLCHKTRSQDPERARATEANAIRHPAVVVTKAKSLFITTPPSWTQGPTCATFARPSCDPRLPEV
jgi:hypothetical protein